jgi:hypothetical protein
MAATGRQLKQSVNVFHSLMLYLRLPAYEKKKNQTGVYFTGGGEDLVNNATTAARSALPRLRFLILLREENLEHNEENRSVTRFNKKRRHRLT